MLLRLHTSRSLTYSRSRPGSSRPASPFRISREPRPVILLLDVGPGEALAQLVEEGLCLFQIGRIEAFGEPGVDRREKVAGCGDLALVAQ